MFFFIANDTGDVLNKSILSRPVFYSIISGDDVFIKDNFTDKFSKIRSDCDDEICIRAKVDNQILNSTVIFNQKDSHRFCDLQLLIDSYVDGEVIIFYNDFKFDYNTDSLYVEGVAVNKSVVIDFNGISVDGDFQSEIFNINSSGVVLKNLSIQNAIGTAISWFSNNTKINYLSATNISNLIYIIGDNAIINIGC